MMESIEGMYCKVHTRGGSVYTGTVLTKAPAVHTYDDARSMERVVKTWKLRLDEEADSRQAVKDLGIDVGDYISFDPMLCGPPSGFIKSRHLDDKASAAVLMGLFKRSVGGGIRAGKDAEADDYQL